MLIWKAPLKRSRIASVLAALVAPAAMACEPLDIAARRREPTIAHPALVAQDLRDGRRWETDEAGVSSRHPPWSTFKIPHQLVALEAGAPPSSTPRVAWDAARRLKPSHWPAGWRPSQSWVTGRPSPMAAFALGVRAARPAHLQRLREDASARLLRRIGLF